MIIKCICLVSAPVAELESALGFNSAEQQLEFVRTFKLKIMGHHNSAVLLVNVSDKLRVLPSVGHEGENSVMVLL